MKIFRKISIVIPVYNEEKYIETTLNKVRKADTLGFKKEIIAVNDGSIDATFNILKKYQKKHKDVHIINKENEGKGSAIQCGFLKATGDILVIQDADFEYNPADIKKVIRPIISGKAEVVYGSRHLIKGNPYFSPSYYIGGLMVDTIISKTLGVKLTDAITGSKAFSRKAYKKIIPIESKGFEIEAELTVKAVKAGYVPLEVPITYKPRSHDEGKNIRWHHGFTIIKALFKFLFLS